MAALTSINAAPIFKPLFANNLDKKTMMMGKPILAHLRHETNFNSEKGIVVPLQYGSPNGRSHSATISEANQNPGKYGSFTFTPTTDYLTSSLAGRVVRMAKAGGDRSQFVNVLKQEMDSALETFGIQQAKEAYGSRDGYRGQVGSTSTTSLVLKKIQDAVLWEPGMQVQASQTAGGALRDSGDYVSLVSVNWTTGTLVADANWSNIASIANDDYLYQRGDAKNGGTAVCQVGLADFVPETDPSGSEDFFGVDRSVNRTHLAGIYWDASGESMQTVFIRGNRKTDFARGGGFADATWFVNSEKFAQLAIAYEGSRYIDSDNQYNIGIEAFRVGGKRIMPDPFCPYTDAILVGKNAMYRATCGDQPSLNSEDSLEYRLTAGDIYQFQMVVDGNNICQQPWALMRAKLPTF